MLAKKNRADTKIVEQVLKTGKFINSQFLTFKYKLNSAHSIPRISFVAPKSITKLAVNRNKLRRLGYQALKKHINTFPIGIEGVFVFKKPLSSIKDIENEIKNILSKIH